jgi:aspartate/methionine/tyrosine aminotransferase
VCNPTNPTAYVPSRTEVETLIKWAKENNLIVIADEAYARYVYDGAVFTPQMIFRNLYENLVTVTSLTKNYAFGNWRVGYINAPEALLTQIHYQFEWDALDVGPVPQAAANAVIGGPQSWIEPIMATYQPNRNRLMAALEKLGLPIVLPAGGPFAFVDFTVLELRSRELEAHLLAHGIPAVAGDAFNGPDTYARIMFGGKLNKTLADISDAAENKKITREVR